MFIWNRLFRLSCINGSLCSKHLPSPVQLTLAHNFFATKSRNTNCSITRLNNLPSTKESILVQSFLTNKLVSSIMPPSTSSLITDDLVTQSVPQSTSGKIINVFLSFAIKTGAFGSLLAIGVMAFLYVKQDSLLYFPEIGGIPRRPADNPRGYRSPGEHSIPFETHMIEAEDGVSISSWLMLHPDSLKEKLPTIIFFHGNAGNIGLRIPNAIQMYKYLHANILLVEYRGYGDSETVKPNEKGLKLDAEAALRYIQTHAQIDSGRIFIFGRSLGGAVAFHLAQYAEKNGIPLAGVLVENTFLSISKMVDHLMPYIAPFKSLVLKINWDSSKIVSELKTPILYLSGDADELVPASHMEQLFKLSTQNNQNSCVRMHIVNGGTHNETWTQGGIKYWERMKSFIAEALSIVASPSSFNAGRADSIERITSDADIGIEIDAECDDFDKKKK